MQDLELDSAGVTAGMDALGCDFLGCDPPVHGPAAWAEMCRAKGLNAEFGHAFCFEDLESALHNLGPWEEGERCNCGWRASEVWRRLSAIAGGRSPMTMAEEQELWM